MEGVCKAFQLEIKEPDIWKYEFTARRACVLSGRKFLKGEKIQAAFIGRALVFLGNHNDGSWDDGYTSSWLSNNAIEIVDVSKNEVILRREKVIPSSCANRKLMTQQEAEYFLRLQPKTLNINYVPFTKVGGKKLYIKESLDCWLKWNELNKRWLYWHNIGDWRKKMPELSEKDQILKILYRIVEVQDEMIREIKLLSDQKKSKKDDLLTAEEVAEILRINPSTISKWVSMQKIPFVKVGGRVRFKRDSIDRWIKSHEVGEHKVWR